MSDPATCAPHSPLRCVLLSGFGMGYMPVASGTFGSAAACAISLLAWGLFAAAGWGPVGLNIVWIVLTLLAAAGCVTWGRWACDYYSARCRKPGDPGHVVLDEFAGQWVALIGLPMIGWQQTLAVLAVQFVAFRFFDVLKAPPARQLERLPFGWGILLDDIAAGVCANIVGQVVFRALWFV
jgi:phosphatidylglycerophosphatase A